MAIRGEVDLRNGAPPDAFALRVPVFPRPMGAEECGIKQLLDTGVVKAKPTQRCAYPGAALELMHNLAAMLPWRFRLTVFDRSVATGAANSSDIGQMLYLRNGTFDMLDEEKYMTAERWHDRHTVFSQPVYSYGSIVALTTGAPDWSGERLLYSDPIAIYKLLSCLDDSAWLTLVLLASLVYLTVSLTDKGASLWGLLRAVLPSQSWTDDWHNLRSLVAPLSLLCVLLYGLYGNLILVNMLEPARRLPFTDVASLTHEVAAGRVRVAGITWPDGLIETLRRREELKPLAAAIDGVGGGVVIKMEDREFWAGVQRGETAILITQEYAKFVRSCYCEPEEIYLTSAAFSLNAAFQFAADFNATRLGEFNNALMRNGHVITSTLVRYNARETSPMCEPVTCEHQRKRQPIVVSGVLHALLLLAAGLAVGAAVCALERAWRRRRAYATARQSPAARRY